MRPRPCDVGAVHLALSVDDLDAVLDSAAPFGRRLPDRPERRPRGPAGTRSACMRDTRGGTVLELVQGATVPEALNT